MRRKGLVCSAVAVIVLMSIFFLTGIPGQETKAVTSQSTIDDIVKGFETVAAASVADAMDEITGIRSYMSHDMRPIFNCKMVGRAVTTLIRPSVHAKDQASPHHMLEAIDEGAPGSILVVKVEESMDIAGIGGLLANGCKARDFAGVVVDGSARDAQEIEDMGLPCFARGYTPSTSVKKYVSILKNEPIKCAGVDVRPGDIIIGDRDGVVVVPVEHAARALELARGYEAKERQMVPLIHQYKSIKKAVEQFNRM